MTAAPARAAGQLVDVDLGHGHRAGPYPGAGRAGRPGCRRRPAAASSSGDDHEPAGRRAARWTARSPPANAAASARRRGGATQRQRQRHGRAAGDGPTRGLGCRRQRVDERRASARAWRHEVARRHDERRGAAAPAQRGETPAERTLAGVVVGHGRPARRRRCGSTSTAPGGPQGGGHPDGHRHAVDLDARLVAPHAAAGAAGQHGARPRRQPPRRMAARSARSSASKSLGGSAPRTWPMRSDSTAQYMTEPGLRECPGCSGSARPVSTDEVDEPEQVADLVGRDRGLDGVGAAEEPAGARRPGRGRRRRRRPGRRRRARRRRPRRCRARTAGGRRRSPPPWRRRPGVGRRPQLVAVHARPPPPRARSATATVTGLPRHLGEDVGDVVDDARRRGLGVGVDLERRARSDRSGPQEGRGEVADGDVGIERRRRLRRLAGARVVGDGVPPAPRRRRRCRRRRHRSTTATAASSPAPPPGSVADRRRSAPAPRSRRRRRRRRTRAERHEPDGERGDAPVARASRLQVRRRPRRVELAEEQRAALGCSSSSPIAAGGRSRPASARRKPAVVVVRPAHVAAPPPAVGPQAVEATVVADPERGVALDVVAAELAEPGPAVEERGASGPRPRRPRRAVARRPARRAPPTASAGSGSRTVSGGPEVTG